ncbi:MAG: DUF861 domain-containing protein [Clostridia bacterium]|nr:DUF861 domain-containing protein [Clostridia bacterium]
MNIEKTELENLVRKIVGEKLNLCDVKSVNLTHIPVREEDRLDTGNPMHKVYTRDVFTLEESPRLGCGIMEMTDTTFDWNLQYDEIDYVIDGTLSIISNNSVTTANAGEIILIPKGSSIKFSVDGFARFMYVTYPANWAEI